VRKHFYEELTKHQIHSNWMLAMRRFMGEIELLLRIENTDDPLYPLSSDEASRICLAAGFDEEHLKRTLEGLLKLVHRDH
jgi:hypothetical protein